MTPWWVLVVYARKPSQIDCYVFSLEDIRLGMTQDPGTRSGKPENERKFWFHRKFYTPGGQHEDTGARNAWHRLGTPRQGADRVVV